MPKSSNPNEKDTEASDTDDESDEDQSFRILASEEKEVLGLLLQLLKSLIPIVNEADTLISIGIAWRACEAALKNEAIDAHVSINAAYECGDDDFLEGTIVSIDVFETGFVFTKIDRSYSRRIGSDHASTVFGRLAQQSSIDIATYNRWEDEFRAVLNQDGAKLSGSLDP